MAFSVRIAIFFLFSIFLHFYFSIYIVQLLLKFYDFFKNILHNAIHLNYWCIFWFGVLNWLCRLFLTYGNIKMARHRYFICKLLHLHCNTIFVFSLCTFIYLFLKLFWLCYPKSFRYFYIYIYIIYEIFISVNFITNLFGMKLIYHMKLGDLCEKNYLQFFYEFLLT